jgi:hypothetical protein
MCPNALNLFFIFYFLFFIFYFFIFYHVLCIMSSPASGGLRANFFSANFLVQTKK